MSWGVQMDRAEGHVDGGFERVRDAFAQGHPPEAGGAQLCVYRNGSPVLDLWIGRDPVNDLPFDGDTLSVLMSCGKAPVAMLVHALAQRGALDLDGRIADLWPEFAANGKAAITVAHVLSHSSGLFAFPLESGIDARAVLDQPRAAAALAAARPYWEPGTAYLYHAITYGVLLGEVVSRATGTSLGRQFAEIVAGPLALDMWIGLPAEHDARIAPHLPPTARPTPDDWRGAMEGLGLDPADPLIAGFIGSTETTTALIDLLRTREGRAAEIPAANVIGNARAVARLYAACIGPVDGVRLLDPETLETMRRPRTDHLGPPSPFVRLGDDPQRFGLGVELPRRSITMLGPDGFGHPGAGGRFGFADPSSGLAVGYACNGMLWDGRHPDPRWIGWMQALADIAGADAS